MFGNAMLFIHILSVANGGVGLARICEHTGLSKYKARKVLAELRSCGAIARQKNQYVLTLYGACLAVADQASQQGYGVSFTENMDYMPAYQKGF